MGFIKSVGKAIGSIAVNPVLGQASYLTDSFSGKKQQENANKMAMTAWNMMNDYNHPAQQMQRLKEAGLNPLLVYGSGSVTGNTTGSPALVGGGISTTAESAFKGLSNIMSVLQGQANLDNTHAQTSASNAAAGASTAQASNLNAQASVNQQRADFERQSIIADLDYKKAMTRKLEQDQKKGVADTRRAEAIASMDEAAASLFGNIPGGAQGSKFGRDVLKILREFMK